MFDRKRLIIIIGGVYVFCDVYPPIIRTKIGCPEFFKLMRFYCMCYKKEEIQSHFDQKLSDQNTTEAINRLHVHVLVLHHQYTH